MRDRGFHRGIFVTDVLLPEFVDVLLIDGRSDGFDRHGVDDKLKVILRPFELLVLLELKEVPAFGLLFDVRMDKIGLCELGAVEGRVGGHVAHFWCVEDECEVAVAPTPRGGVEVRCERG